MTSSAQELASLIERLNAGEDPTKVREEFVKAFQHVSVQEIMDAEQVLMDAGMPEQEIQKVCDLHSALFHGKTETEVMAAELADQKHPWLIETLILENEVLAQLIIQARNAQSWEELKPVLEHLRDLKKHYAKKEELLMPKLYDYGVEGPSKVMWGVDDEILKELAILYKTGTAETFAQNKDRLEALLTRMLEMVYKEQNILFPMAIQMFTRKDWLELYPDADEYGYAWIEKPAPWEAGEKYILETEWEPAQGSVELPTGSMTIPQLEAMLKVLPLDITFIDKDDNLIFFTNEGKVFARPKSALKRKVYQCHPPRVVPIVEKMLSDFKAGNKDRVERWLPIPGKPVKVVYQAIYDSDGKYAGTVETVQEFEQDAATIQRFMEKASS